MSGLSYYDQHVPRVGDHPWNPRGPNGGVRLGAVVALVFCTGRAWTWRWGDVLRWRPMTLMKNVFKKFSINMTMIGLVSGTLLETDRFVSPAHFPNFLLDVIGIDRAMWIMWIMWINETAWNCYKDKVPSIQWRAGSSAPTLDHEWLPGLAWKKFRMSLRVDAMHSPGHLALYQKLRWRFDVEHPRAPGKWRDVKALRIEWKFQCHAYSTNIIK